MEADVSERETDEALFAAWQSGDAAAGSRLFERYFDRIFAFFAAKLDIEADELTQRTFEACLAEAPRFRHESTFRSFLFGIARIQLLRQLQSRMRDQRWLQPAEDSLLDIAASPSALVALHDRQRIIRDGLHQIPLDFQIVLELFYWHELQIPEIAAALDIAPGTVKSRLSRGKAMLRERIAQMRITQALRDDTLLQLDSGLPRG
jgi:RNA polymerase sigma-70 factor (ECF subfamily)